MKRIALTTTFLCTGFLLAVAVPAAAAQRNSCPRVPSVTNDPLNRSYHAGDMVPAELLDPPFIWVDCPAPAFPSGAARSERTRVVYLSVVVDETGRVQDARPRGAIDPEGFYDAAVAAIREWRTNRPVWHGLSVKASLAVDVRFTRQQTPPPAETPAAPPVQPAAPVSQPVSAPQAAQPAQPEPATTAPVQQPPPVTPTPVEEKVEPVTPATVQPEPAPVTAPPTPTPVSAPREAPPARLEPRPAPYTQAPQARDAEAFKVEYYYKVRWGFADEFWQLFNRNHWPLLRRQMELGRIIDVYADRPRYHSTEEGRWDYRVTIVFRSAADANTPFDEAPLERQLFPDIDRYHREEQRRFELLLAHWDVPIRMAPLAP